MSIHTVFAEIQEWAYECEAPPNPMDVLELVQALGNRVHELEDELAKPGSSNNQANALANTEQIADEDLPPNAVRFIPKGQPGAAVDGPKPISPDRRA